MAERAITERRPGRTKRVKRRWSVEAKLRIVEESNAAGRPVSDTAHRHGVAPNLLFLWRKQAREGRLVDEGAGGFAVAKIVSPAIGDARLGTVRARGPGVMEIALDDACVFVDASVETEALARVLAALRRSAREEFAR